MPRYIDGDALYEQTAEWEARALAVVEKLNSKPLGEMDVDEITEWRKWSCVLNERSAFKHDVANAPTSDVVEVVRCKNCKHLSDDRIAPEWQRICRWLGVGKSDDGFCDEGERKEAEDGD